MVMFRRYTSYENHITWSVFSQRFLQIVFFRQSFCLKVNDPRLDQGCLLTSLITSDDPNGTRLGHWTFWRLLHFCVDIGVVVVAAALRRLVLARQEVSLWTISDEATFVLSLTELTKQWISGLRTLRKLPSAVRTSVLGCRVSKILWQKTVTILFNYKYWEIIKIFIIILSMTWKTFWWSTIII